MQRQPHTKNTEYSICIQAISCPVTADLLSNIQPKLVDLDMLLSLTLTKTVIYTNTLGFLWLSWFQTLEDMVCLLFFKQGLAKLNSQSSYFSHQRSWEYRHISPHLATEALFDSQRTFKNSRKLILWWFKQIWQCIPSFGFSKMVKPQI